MTYYQRGANAERKVKRILEDAGEIVVRSAGSHGAFDLISVQRVHRANYNRFPIRLIQVKMIDDCDKAQARANRELAQLMAQYPLYNRALEVWVRCKGGKWYLAVGEEVLNERQSQAKLRRQR